MLSLSEKLLLTPIVNKTIADVYWLEHDRVGRWLHSNPWLSTLRKLSTSVKTICVSQLSVDLYTDLGWPVERTLAIPNGIDPDRFDRTPSERGSDDFTIGCIARLSNDKGVDLLIEAMENVPDAHLDIVGEGKEEAELKRQILIRDLSDRVTILPSHEDLAPFYQSIDALVLPSREHDPFGLVAAEAMLLGTPVIVTDVCGIAGYLEHGKDALIVPAGSSAALQEALTKLQDPEAHQRIATAGRQAAENLFLLERMVDQYEQLFNTKTHV